MYPASRSTVRPAPISNKYTLAERRAQSEADERSYQETRAQHVLEMQMAEVHAAQAHVVLEAGRAAHATDQDTYGLATAQTRYAAVEGAHANAITATSMAAALAASQDRDANHACDRLTTCQNERTAIAASARAQSDKVSMFRAGVGAAHERELATEAGAHRAAEVAVLSSSKMHEAEAVLAAAEMKQSAASVAAVATSAALQEAIAKDKTANDVLTSAKEEVAAAAEMVNRAVAEAMLAEEEARARAAGHAAAKAGYGEAVKRHQEQSNIAASAQAELAQVDHACSMLQVEVEAQRTRRAVSSRDLYESQAHEASTRAAADAAASAVMQARNKLAVSEGKLAAHHEALAVHSTLLPDLPSAAVLSPRGAMPLSPKATPPSYFNTPIKRHPAF